MQYRSAEVITMTKTRTIPDDELYPLILKLKDEKGMTEPDIADYLKRLGHVSRRTKEPVASSTINSMYKRAQLFVGGKGAEIAPGGGNAAQQKLNTIAAAIEAGIEDKHLKLFIKKILEQP